ncbi:MAG: imidazole glycerol phosphate synthase subunit HisH [Cellvibrionaceae bacterium]
MTAKHLAIIDYGMGNLHSVASAIKSVAPDVRVDITADEKIIEQADHIIFPGVGAIRDCMAGINEIAAGKMVSQALDMGKPLLGVCVGLQALMTDSEENGGVSCLDILQGHVCRFPENAKDVDGSIIKIPHMGWNNVQQTIDHPLWNKIQQDARFYFVHSYYVSEKGLSSQGSGLKNESSIVAGRCDYGVPFAAAVAKNNLFAVQFHPEKSHTDGLQLLKNFVNWNGLV